MLNGLRPWPKLVCQSVMSQEVAVASWLSPLALELPELTLEPLALELTLAVMTSVGFGGDVSAFALPSCLMSISSLMALAISWILSARGRQFRK